MIASTSASSSADGIQSAVSALAFTCSGDIAPAMTLVQPGCAARQEIATVSSETPCDSPQVASASTMSSLASVT